MRPSLFRTRVCCVSFPVRYYTWQSRHSGTEKGTKDGGVQEAKKAAAARAAARKKAAAERQAAAEAKKVDAAQAAEAKKQAATRAAAERQQQAEAKEAAAAQDLKGKRPLTAEQLAAEQLESELVALEHVLQAQANGLLTDDIARQMAWELYMSNTATPNPEYLALDAQREYLRVRAPSLPPTPNVRT